MSAPIYLCGIVVYHKQNRIPPPENQMALGQLLKKHKAIKSNKLYKPNKHGKEWVYPELPAWPRFGTEERNHN
jgi:hypothetical protein